MIISISYIRPFHYISFKKEDYIQEDLYKILKDIIKSNSQYTPKDHSVIIDRVNELLQENIIGIVIKLVNDINFTVYGIESINNERV